MLPLLCFFPLVLAFGNELAWYASSSRTSLSTDPAVFVAKTAIDLCTLPVDTGGCTKELIRYYYDPVADDCKRFTFSGCGGNSNRFMRRTHCRSRCVRNRQKILSLHEPSYRGASGNNHKEAKHRRTLTTTTVPITTTTEATTTPTTRAPPVTPVLKKIEKVEISSAITQCPHCDPLFGVCIDGECGCMRGFKKLGRICIDINECDDTSICPSNSRCTNTIGSFRCDCDAGFSEGGECKIVPESCDDEFDVLLTEEDCNNGEQIVRYYYEKDSASCRQFFYGGCKSTSRNIFNDLQTCNTLCMARGIKPNEDAARQITIPQKLKLNLEMTTTPPSDEIKIQEATKIVKIMKHINPNEKRCGRIFDEEFRVECVSAEWQERFFWNNLVRECEPFWYDVSCDVRDTAGKNFFLSLEDCRAECGEEDATPKEKQEESVTAETRKPTEQAEVTDADPLKLITTTEPTSTTTTTVKSVGIKETGNFMPKTPSVEFDKKKFMEEFRKKLNALPDSSLKPSFLDFSKFATKRPPFTLDPALFGKVPKEKEFHEEKSTSPDVSLFKEVTAVPAQMVDQSETPTTADPLDLSKFVTKKAPFTLNPALFGELLDTSDKDAKSPDASVNNPSSIGTTVDTTTVDPLDLSKFVTKRPPFKLFIFDIQDAEEKIMALKPETTIQTTQTSSIEDQEEAVTHDPLDLSKFVTKRPPFTLDPAFFKSLSNLAPTTTIAPTTIDNKEMSRNHYKIQSEESFPVHDIVPIRFVGQSTATTTQKAPTTTSFQDFVTREKEKITNLLDELNKPVDLCEEPLHPTLEEDCSDEQWVIRWYFNSDRGACKTFWYGGCPSHARNFFQSHALCEAACAHKIPARDDFKPKYVVRPESTTTSSTKLHTTSIPAIERSIKSKSMELGEEVHVPPKSEEKDEEKEKKPRFITTTRLPPVPMKEEYSVTSSEIHEPGETLDPCSSGYDEKWDADCSGDNWQVRSYFDVTANKCKRFWWGGCSTDNRNIWKDQQTCITACGHKMKIDRRATTETPAVLQDGRHDAPSNLVAHPGIFELPQASALVGDASLNDLPPKPSKNSKKSRKNRHKFDLRWNVVQTTYEVAKAPSSSIFGMQNDAPASEEESEPALAKKDRFEVDLQRQLATKKREHEARADLAFSAAAQHPVTIACMFVSLVCLFAW